MTWSGADPIGPVDQNLDDVRTVACKLVEPRGVCVTPTPPKFDPGTGSSGGGGFVGVVLWALLIVAVIALAYVIARYLAGWRSTRRPKDDIDDVDPDDDELIGTVVIDRSREPGGWRDEADQHRAAGRFRDALRCRYRALVGDLARRGLLDEIPGRTTGEERVQLRSSAPQIVAAFDEAADLFDDAWYGFRDVTADDDDRLQTLDRDVLSLAPVLAHRVPRAYEVVG